MTPQEDPAASGPEEVTASASGEKPYVATLFLSYLVPLSTVAGFSLWAWCAGHDMGAIATLVAALIAIWPVMEFLGRHDERTEATRRQRIFLYAFGIVFVFTVTAGLLLSLMSEDVTDRAELRGAVDMGPGSTARLSVDAKPSGDELNVTIAAEDQTLGAATPCVPLGKLRFQGSDIAESRTVELDDGLTQTLPLRAAGPRVSVDVTLLHGDEGCRITLVLKSAAYE